MHAPIRFDDLTAGQETSFELVDCVGELVARSVDQVRPVLEQVERAAASGRWVAGFVTYEASPAFDSALVVRSRALGDTYEDLPLAWFGVYEGMHEVEPLRRRAGGPSCYGLSPWNPSVTQDEHAGAVDAIRQAIGLGDTYQVNHTFRLRASFSGDPGELYRDLIVVQRGAYGAYIDTGRFQVLSASPERFFRLSDRRIDVRPMKGTAPRGRWTAEDAALAERLVNSKKERAENLMIVDLLRSDLGRIASFGSVKVDELFTLERFETVWQLTSQVGAELRDDVGLADVFGALFPSGSVTGAPKSSTMELIRELETTPRGVYCGAIGFVPPQGEERGAHFNVAIRTVVVDSDSGIAEYGTGGAITWDSTSGSEYDEALLKSRVLHAGKQRFGLIETIRWEDGEFTWLDRHLERLQDSAAYFGFRYSEHAVRDALTKHSTVLYTTVDTAARVRLVMDRLGQFNVETAEVDLLPFVESPQDLAFGMHPVYVTVAGDAIDRADVSLYHKTTLRGTYQRALDAAPGVDDVLLTNDAGRVTESTVANIVVRLGGVWLTPPLEEGCLPGVYRAELLSRGEIEEAPISLDDLARATDIGLINSVRGWRRAVVVPRTDFTGRTTVRASS